ncbi:MAG: spore maturation protein [Clostridia bacterium]|nr:spore maturation protein [Clostridia bacterium]
MKFFLIISDFIIPLIMLGIVAHGIRKKRPVYDDFVDGAKKGIKTVIGIMPTLIGLMVGVGVLRSSGFLDMLTQVTQKFSDKIFFPAQLIPLTFIRMFSSSAATGLALDIFNQYGPDSYIGIVTSIMMSCTETIFYTMSVYCIAAGIKKTRWTLPGALLCTFAGIVASVLLARMM